MKRVVGLICAGAMLAGLNAVAQQDAAAAMAQAMAAFGQMAEANKTAVGGGIDAKEMRALLPEKDAYAGFRRIKASTESNAVMGFKMTVAEAQFRSDKNDATVTIKYSDIGNLGGFAKMAFQMHEIDEETEFGFKRTTKIDGYNAMEEFDGERRKSANIKIHPGDQIIVEIDANGLEFDVVKKMLSKIDLKKLAELKPAAAEAN